MQVAFRRAASCKLRWLRAPATTFVITRWTFQSDDPANLVGRVRRWRGALPEPFISPSELGSLPSPCLQTRGHAGPCGERISNVANSTLCEVPSLGDWGRRFATCARVPEERHLGSSSEARTESERVTGTRHGSPKRDALMRRSRMELPPALKSIDPQIERYSFLFQAPWPRRHQLLGGQFLGREPVVSSLRSGAG